MHKPAITVKNLGDFSLAGFAGTDPTPTLASLLTALAPLNLDFHLSAGTALGIHRDQRFIPHDTDVDLALRTDWSLDQTATASAIREAMAGHNLPCVRTLYVDEHPIQLVFVDTLNDNTLIDLEFYYAGITPGKYVHYKPEGYLTISPYNTRYRAFGDLSVPLPEPIEEYLTERYGQWQTPTNEKGDWQDYTACFTPWR